MTDPLIIIEGPDGAGKSTLAEAVHEELLNRGYVDASLTHLGPPKYDARRKMSFGAQAMRQVLETFVENRHGGLVMDRGYWGEMVYSPIFRPEKCIDDFYGTLDEDSFQYMNEIFMEYGAVQVLVTNIVEVLLVRLFQRGDEDLLSELDDERRRQLELVLAGYNRVLDHFGEYGLSVPIVQLNEPADTQKAAKMLVDLAIANQEEALSA